MAVDENIEKFSDPSQRKRKSIPLGKKPLVDDDADSRKSTKRKLWNATSDKLDFNSIREALHVSSAPEDVLCRTNQLQVLQTFLDVHVGGGKAGSLYVSGCPGTGKSLLVSQVLKEYRYSGKDPALNGHSDSTKNLTHSSTRNQRRKIADPMSPPATSLFDQPIRVVEINCMALVEPGRIFQKILENLLEESYLESESPLKAMPPTDAKTVLWKTVRGHKRPFVLVLDEMDALMTKDQSILYDIFRLPNLTNSACVLIGIANTMDLTDRFLPKLRAANCHPDTLCFPTYTTDQIATVLRQRLQGFENVPFDCRALELCARKVAASSGDMRKALEICRMALECLELELQRQEDGTHDCPPDSLAQVQIGHMAQALSAAFKSPTVERIKCLPQHQQLVMCSAVRLFSGKKKDSNISQLQEAYISACKISAVNPVSFKEFIGMCSVLADQGLVSVGPGRQEKLRRITLKVTCDDVVFALQTIRFFRVIMEVQVSSAVRLL